MECLMCIQAQDSFFLREPTYCNNLSRSPLASLWWEAVKQSSGKTHLVEESYGSLSDVSAKGGYRP